MPEIKKRGRVDRSTANRIFSPSRASDTPLSTTPKHDTHHRRQEYHTQEERRQIALRREKILDAREHNTNMLAKIGILLSPKTGRNLIKNHLDIFPQETVKKQLAYVKKKQQEFRASETEKEHEVKRRSDLAEEIITAQLTKCLSGEFYMYRSNLYGDIRGGYDMVGIDRETGETEFVIDVTLGKNNPNHPINEEKIEKTYQNNRNGVMVYDGYYEQDNGMYAPTYDMMAPLLSISLPDRTSKGEDNLMNMIDRMSPSFEEPSKKDFENTLYLIQRLKKSLHNIKDIYNPNKNQNFFNMPAIQKRVGGLYGMLSPEEKSHWKSIPEEVHYEIEEWRQRIEGLEGKFYEAENTLAEKAGVNPRMLEKMT